MKNRSNLDHDFTLFELRDGSIVTVVNCESFELIQTMLTELETTEPKAADMFRLGVLDPTMESVSAPEKFIVLVVVSLATVFPVVDS